MAFATKQTAGRIESNPTGSGQVGFRPGVQIRAILRNARRAFERHPVRAQLNRVSLPAASRGASGSAFRFSGLEKLHLDPDRGLVLM